MREDNILPYDGMRSNTVGEGTTLPPQKNSANIPAIRKPVGATIGRPRNKFPLHKRGVEGAAPYRV